MPETVLECLKDEKKYPLLFDYDKDQVIKKMLNSDYLSENEYRSKKLEKIAKEKDKVCYNFLNEETVK